MNNDFDKKIDEYLANLPKEIKNFIENSDWQERLEKICLKYSINENQKENLFDKVALILVGIEIPNQFEVELVQELGISRLLAGEIAKEIESRIFDYGMNEIQKNKKVQDIENEEEYVETDIPEIRPDIVPAIEEGEVAHDTEPEIITEDKTEKQTQNVSGVNIPRYTVPDNLPSEEIMQQKEEIKPPEIPNIESHQIPMEPKPIQSTMNTKPAEKQQTVPDQVIKDGRYVVDPYREPLE